MAGRRQSKPTVAVGRSLSVGRSMQQTGNGDGGGRASRDGDGDGSQGDFSHIMSYKFVTCVNFHAFSLR